MSERLVVEDAHGRAWVRIPHVERMEPFFISVVSASDPWLYASSRGGLTAGRTDPDHALFPYWTDDRLHRAHHEVGGFSVLHVRTPDGAEHAWEPWRARPTPGIARHVLKSVEGDRLVFEEEHATLGLVHRTRWALSERFGIVRTVTVESRDVAVSIRVADGLQAVLPAGAPLSLVQTASCLVNAYTRNEWDAEGRLALFTLEAAPSDRAEPAESLVANVAWVTGLEVDAVVLTDRQLDALATGHPAAAETRVTGRPGAFVVTSRFDLAPGAQRTWHVVADVARTHADVAILRRRSGDLHAAIEAELDATTRALDGILADVDGLQRTADPVIDARHRANALFNAMRGGVPLDEHRVDPAHFRRFVARRNSAVAVRSAATLAGLGDAPVEVEALVARLSATRDPDLARLSMEFLPLWFGRRHGDPSRPWNRFSIRVRDEEGRRRVAWEGNWRDVFQNWEALLLAYPAFLQSVIAVFVNATTLDGHNPYRITSEGIDWEVPEPENPWSNLGYWGDHQVSYLTRLLELSEAHHPGRLAALLDDARFSSADVPYRIRPYDALVADPRDAIVFDRAAHQATERRVEAIGADGRLVSDGTGVLHLGLAEKLLLPVLAKLTSLVPGAGIWMNTQRPEWNDANNALAGHGVSVVTAAYLRRHVDVLERLFARMPDTVDVLAPTATWLDEVLAVLEAPPEGPWSPRSRRRVMDALGAIGTAVRARLYAGDLEPRVALPRDAFLGLCRRARVWLDDALVHARRPDGLVDGYDLIAFGEGTAAVRRLYPMLEGQVAMLASGILSAAQATDLVERMYGSDLYREDVRTFLLYPDRELPSFLEKNRVPEDGARIPVVQAALAEGRGRLILRDADGVLRFAAHLRNARDVEAVLDAIGASDTDRDAVLDLWERTFHHHAFTGRSGTMYAYEGLGSVYWHMVGKLLVAVQECHARARAEGADEQTVARLGELVRRVRDGLGYNRTPAEFGAIPTDPYSHTPAGRGAQQPGMTGLVKEELIARRREVGVLVEDGHLVFRPDDLDPSELLAAPVRWTVPAGVRPARTVDLPAGSLGLLVCGTPVIIARARTPAVTVVDTHGAHRVAGHRLDAETSARVFQRDPTLLAIHVDAVVPRP